VTEKTGVSPAVRADFSGQQIRELPTGSPRRLSTAQFSPGGEPQASLRAARTLQVARRRRGCGTVENRPATARGGRFSKRLWETDRDPPRAGGFPRWLWEGGGKGAATGRRPGRFLPAFHSHRQARQFHSPPLLGRRCRPPDDSPMEDFLSTDSAEDPPLSGRDSARPGSLLPAHDVAGRLDLYRRHRRPEGACRFVQPESVIGSQPLLLGRSEGRVIAASRSIWPGH
jgi:hypothetical protein